LLRVEAHDLPAANVGDSAGLRVGELVFAIGHPWGQPWVVTGGIISGLGEAQVQAESGTPQGGARTAAYIRSDVRLRPGNSGGPLVNARGEVIGINAMVFGGDLAVAIPSHVASAWTVTSPEPRQAARLGVGVQAAELPAALRQGAWAGRQAGLLVVAVEPDSPAGRAPLLVGDLLLDAASGPLENAGALRDVLAEHAGQPLRFYLLRAGAVMPVEVSLG
jgi:serine protease Do